MSNQPLRDRLFEQEKRSPAFEIKFREELHNMLERKLTFAGKIPWFFATLLGVFFVVQFGYVAITTPPGFPVLARLGFVAGAVFGAAWAGLSVWTLRRGSINWLRHDNAVQGLTFGFVLVLQILFMILGSQMPDKAVAIQMTLNGAVFFMIFGIPALFTMRINRMEATLREHVLRVELEVAELTSRIRRDT